MATTPPIRREVRGQPAAVGQAGECVGQRLELAGLEQPSVLAVEALGHVPNWRSREVEREGEEEQHRSGRRAELGRVIAPAARA